MIGYYPPLEKEELFYSSLARAIAIYPGRPGRGAANHLLGSPHRSFGGLLPNNGSALLDRVPSCSGLSEQSILRGSTFHLISPLLEAEQRRELRESIFTGGIRGARNHNTRRGALAPIVLKYCVKCAQEDQEARRPQYWRVLPNCGAVNCCDEHGIRLQSTSAEFRDDQLYRPSNWIRWDVATPENASPIEIAVAKDIRWLFEQESSFTPGFVHIAHVLRMELRNKLACRDMGPNRLATQIMESILEMNGPLLDKIDPGFQIVYAESSRSSLIDGKVRLPLQRYALLAQLAGFSFKELFHRCVTEMAIDYGDTRRLTNRGSWIASAKVRLERIIQESPGLGRSELRLKNKYVTDLIRAVDRGWYEAKMPKRRRRGKNSGFDWPLRDQIVCSKIWSAMRKLPVGQDLSTERILRMAGLSTSLFARSGGRLPQARKLIFRLADEHFLADDSSILGPSKTDNWQPTAIEASPRSHLGATAEFIYE